MDNVIAPSDLLKEQNTVIIAVGITKMPPQIMKIRAIANSPDSRFSFIVPDFDELDEQVKMLSHQIQTSHLAKGKA